MRRVLCLLAAVAGCLEPGEPRPDLFITPVAGEVVDPASERITGVRVITESAYDDADAATPTCAHPGQTIARNEANTDANGAFSTIVRWTGVPSCARIWAEQGSGTQLRTSDTTIAPLNLSSSSLPLEVILTLRAPASP